MFVNIPEVGNRGQMAAGRINKAVWKIFHPIFFYWNIYGIFTYDAVDYWMGGVSHREEVSLQQRIEQRVHKIFCVANIGTKNKACILWCNVAGRINIIKWQREYREPENIDPRYWPIDYSIEYRSLQYTLVQHPKFFNYYT